MAGAGIICAWTFGTCELAHAWWHLVRFPLQLRCHTVACRSAARIWQLQTGRARRCCCRERVASRGCADSL